MTPDNLLLKALIAQPDDDVLRLAVADWFEENGDSPRAEFVRVQLELARGVADLARRRELEFRQAKLLVTHDADWVAPLARVLGISSGEWGGWVFRRGFVEYFRLRARTVLNRGAELAALTPVRELNIEDDDGILAGLWGQPWVRHLTGVYGLQVTNPVAEAMLASPHLAALRRLGASTEHLTDAVGRRFTARFARVRC